MAVTRSKTIDRVEARVIPGQRAGWRLRELVCTLLAATAVAGGLFLVYRAKSPTLAAAETGLAAKQLLNLNAMGAREELLPALDIIASAAERQEMARKIYYLSGGLPNVGAIRGLLTGEQFRALKPRFVVRRPEQYRRAFLLWSGLFFGAFLLVHAWWSARGFRGDQLFLPIVLLLTGTGLVLMMSLRDPVRDTMLFVDFAQGAIGGCLLLAALSSLDFERIFGKLSYVPLLGSLILSVLLVVFGSGPGTSDAKVNLLGFQPVEIIRILLVFFLAGYFAPRWDVLRHAVERRPGLPAPLRTLNLPPLEYTLPVFVCVALSLLFFFVQKDMGPALVFACLFLVLYGVARASAFLPVAGLLLVAAGFGLGYLAGVPRTVSDRVAMWWAPWNNLARGGDQLAHSLWAFATGGPIGMGVGLGDAQVVPAAHTDLILSAIGEELGFLGIAVVFALYVFLIYRSLQIALRARSDYQFFLAAGMAAVTALQILLIAGGALGVLPLSGVVTPFLSYGRTAMLANFAVMAVLLSISARSAENQGSGAGGQGLGRAHSGSSSPLVARRAMGTSVEGGAGTLRLPHLHPSPFHGPVRATGWVFAGIGALVLAAAGVTQLIADDAVMGRGTLVTQADGVRRYQYNPRFQEIMRIIPKGTIYDRNGLPLATSNWEELERHRAEYRKLGIDIDAACSRIDSRHYPLGGVMFDLLGDLRTRERWGASNTAFLERDLARRLRGFDDRPTIVEVDNPAKGRKDRVLRYDYRELVPLLRHRHDPQSPEVRRILDRPRDVRTSIDSRLQLRVAEILRNQLRQAGRDKGAAVVMEPVTGDLLAAVSLPLPPSEGGAEEPAVAGAYLDRARYGLYPPGSTFKVVTAMAALRTDSSLASRKYACIRLPDGRVGNYVGNSKRPVRDDIRDETPHGSVDLEHGLIVSCNAYFAQLGFNDVGAKNLLATANLLGIAAAEPNTDAQLKASLAQSSYGQGQVVASPFQMARVAATIANDGAAPLGRWVTDENNGRTGGPQAILPPDSARMLGRFMREVVTSGTGRRAVASVAVAGKTGTAELENAPSHAWFIGFAPYGSAKKIAFSVLVENGAYGGATAAPAAAEIVNAAVKLGLARP